MSLPRFICASIACAWLLHCNDAAAQSKPQPPDSAGAAKSVAALERRLAAAEERIAVLEKTQKNHWSWINNTYERTTSTYAVLDCDTKSYSSISSSDYTFVFLASCDKIEPYLEGYRITLAIGNPHSASFSGVKGKMGHGEDGAAALNNETQFSVTGNLTDGRWTTVQVVVNPATPREVRAISIGELEFNAVSLSRP